MKPEADRELDRQAVAKVLAEQFPELDNSSIEHLGSGWEYDAYLVDDNVVLRFPRYADVANGLDQAEAILDFVRTRVGSALHVPTVVLHGRPGLHFPHRFFGHGLIPGRTAEELGYGSAALAMDLGSALAAIHSIPAGDAQSLGIGPQKWNCRTAFDGLVELAGRVDGVRDIVPGAFGWLSAGPTMPPEYAGPPRLLHDDLQPEHIIVDPTSGRLSGIIDWALALGDPAQDLTFIAPWAGWAFTSKLLDAYELPLDDGFVARLNFLARVRAFGGVLHTLLAGEDPTAAVKEAHNVFAAEFAR